MTYESFYTIEQLSNIADVSVRNIRYYTQEGLLPPPDARGRYALYTQAHLDRLRAIQKLKSVYLPLWAIKEQLERLTDAQVRNLLTGQETVTLQDEQSAAFEMREPPADTARDYIARLRSGQPATQPVPLNPAPAQAPPASPIQAPKALQRARFSQQSTEVEESVGVSDSSEESWKRIRLRPRLELHVREPISMDDQILINRLIEVSEATAITQSNSVTQQGEER